MSDMGGVRGSIFVAIISFSIIILAISFQIVFALGNELSLMLDCDYFAIPGLVLLGWSIFLGFREGRKL